MISLDSNQSNLSIPISYFLIPILLSISLYISYKPQLLPTKSNITINVTLND